jgi:ATP/maltotriose-dependent transcriptional regulator MalT
MAAAVLCEAELERGHLDAGAAALRHINLPEKVPDSALFQLALYARGTLRAARGELEPARDDLLLCGRREVALGGVTPAAMAWRSHAALVCARLGEDERARELAREELSLARVFGAPRALGTALRNFGLVIGGSEGIGALEEASSVLADSSAKLQQARALCDLGAALRRANHRRDARAPLAEAIALAAECGAEPLAQRARSELLAAGGRPRRTALRGPDALTPSELRVAELAAAGHGNREIAAELVVSIRTVEFHLSRAYAKLSVGARSELRDALNGSQPASRSTP